MADTGIKILQWNICSFKVRGLELLSHINDYNYDVILLQETNIKAKDRAGIKIQGYSLYFQYPVIGNSKTHGLITAVSNNIPSKYIPSPYVGDSMESLIVEISLPSGKYHIHNIYLGPRVKDWKPEFHEIENTPSILAGDYNARAHLWDHNENPRGKELQDWYYSNNNKFKILNDLDDHTTTHYSTPDLTFVSNALHRKCSWRVNYDILSDIHYGIEITIGLQNYCKEADFVPRYKLDEADWERFATALDSIMQDFNMADIDTLPADNIATLINDKFIKAADETIEKTKYCKTPWNCWFWNAECAPFKRQYRQALSKYRDLRYPRRETRPIYKAAKAAWQEVMTQAKREAWEKIVKEIQLDKNDAKTWRKLKYIRGQPSPRRHPDPEAQAELLATEFAGRTSRDNLPDMVLNELNNLAPIRDQIVANALELPDLTHDQEFTIHELNRVLQVNRKSAPGSDGVHRSMLHHTGPGARQILLAFINKLYKDRRLPSTWKQAEQVPIPKPDKRNAFRPISLLSCVSKTMESMVLNRALTIARPQFSKHLYGFLPQRGTTDGLVTLASAVNEHIGVGKLNNKECIAVYIDLEKAFELAHPLVVAHEASKLGIKGNMLAYIVDYLSDRKGTVKFQGSKSQVKDFDLGTPQGSCISPFLFNIIMNRLISEEPDDICTLRYPDGVKIVSYADDIVIMSNEPERNTLIQQALTTLDQRCRVLGLKISVDKTKFVRYTPGKSNEEPQFTLQGTDIERVPSYKYLGVIFDEKLNWKEHGEKTAAKINKKTNILKSLAGSEWGTSTQSLLRYVNGCLRPIAEYGLQALTRSRTDPFENQAIEKIDAAMRRALKIVLGVPQRTKNELVHVLSDTMPISFRAKQAALIYHDKILHFGPEHPLYESVKKVGNYPIMKPRSTRYKNKNKSNKIINKRKTWAAVMIDMRKQLHLELPDYDNPVIYLPQIDYLVNATFHIHALCDTKENLIKTGKLELEGKRIQDTFVTPELLNSNADSYFTDGSVCQESNQAGAAALWINNSVCALAPFGIQTKITNKTSSMAAELKGIETALEHSLNNPIAREKINIFTDSLSALQALQKIPPVDNVQIINRIVTLIQALKHRDIHFHWIPSHSGIFYNDIADRLAELAKTQGTPTTIQASRSCTRKYIIKGIKSLWNSHIEKLDSRTMDDIKAINPQLKPISFPGMHRKLETTITKLLINAYRKCSHNDNVYCMYCGDAYDRYSTAHYLIQCPITSKYCQYLRELLDDDEFDLDFKAQGDIIRTHAWRAPQLLIKAITNKPPRANCTNNHVPSLDKYIPAM